jgi:hypothetical protein
VVSPTDHEQLQLGLGSADEATAAHVKMPPASGFSYLGAQVRHPKGGSQRGNAQGEGRGFIHIQSLFGVKKTLLLLPCLSPPSCACTGCRLPFLVVAAPTALAGEHGQGGEEVYSKQALNELYAVDTHTQGYYSQKT